MTSNKKERDAIYRLFKMMCLTENYLMAPLYTNASHGRGKLRDHFETLEEKGFCYFGPTGFDGYSRVYLSGAVQEHFNSETIPGLVEFGKTGNWDFYHDALKAMLTAFKRKDIKKLSTHFEQQFKTQKRERIIREEKEKIKQLEYEIATGLHKQEENHKTRMQASNTFWKIKLGKIEKKLEEATSEDAITHWSAELNIQRNKRVDAQKSLVNLNDYEVYKLQERLQKKKKESELRIEKAKKIFT